MAGAEGYFVKGEVSPDTIAEAIENVAQAERRVRHYSPVRKPEADLKSRIKPIMQPM